jgi:hypothetical protein
MREPANGLPQGFEGFVIVFFDDKFDVQFRRRIGAVLCSKLTKELAVPSR